MCLINFDIFLLENITIILLTKTTDILNYFPFFLTKNKHILSSLFLGKLV